MSQPPCSPRPARSEKAHRAILAAAIKLVREVGYDAVAMDAIAARAGVGEATLYRRWKAKEALVCEALERIMRSIPVPDTGTIRSDLRALMREQRALYEDRATCGLLSGLVAAMARSERIAAVVRNGFHKARHDVMLEAVQRRFAAGILEERGALGVGRRRHARTANAARSRCPTSAGKGRARRWPPAGRSPPVATFASSRFAPRPTTPGTPSGAPTRLRVGEIRVYYDVTGDTVEVLAIVAKSEAESWLAQFGKAE
jgi:AcrR family transcriptional regulator